MAMRSLFIGALLFLVLAVEKSSGVTTYVVGDALGWKIPTVGAASYSSWAAQHTFLPGDKLVFNFTTGAHDVANVNKASFDSCDSATTITSLSASPAIITLTSAGHQYFICTIGQHCSLGQQLSVKVLAVSPPPLSLPTSPPAPSPMLIPTQTPVALASAPAQTPAPSASMDPTLPSSSASPPAPFVPEAPLSPLSEGVPAGPTGSFPGIGMGPAGSFPFPQQNSATAAAIRRAPMLMIITAVIGVTIC